MIYFSDFSAAATAARTIAVQDFTAPTSTGLQDYTAAALNGETTVAALIIGGHHDPANSPSESVHASLSLGAMIGTTEACAGFYNLDGQASTTNGRSYQSDRAILLRRNTGVAGWSAAGTAMITNGIRLSWIDADTGGRQCAFAGFAGSSTQAATGSVNMGTGTSAIGVTTGFQPDVVILFGDCGGDVVQANTFSTYSFGFAHSDGTQRCVLGYEANAAADSTPYQAILTDSAIGQITASALSYKAPVGGFSSTGFTITPSASTGSDFIGYLALKFTGRSCKVVDFTTPTSTGNSSITGAGFTPQFALVFLTNLETAPSSFPVTSNDLCSGLSVNFIGNEQWAFSTRVNAGEATTDTASLAKETALLGASATSCNAIEASLVSFDSDGMTLNYSAVQGTGKKGFILFIE